MSAAAAIARRDEVRAAYFEGFQRSDVIGCGGHAFAYRDALHAWEESPFRRIPSVNSPLMRAAFLEGFNTWQNLEPRAPAPARVIVDAWWKRSRTIASLALSTPIVPTTLHRARRKKDEDRTAIRHHLPEIGV